MTNLCRCGAPANDKTAHPGRYITGLPGHTFAPDDTADIGAQVNERLDQLADAIVSLKTPPQ